jgi:hypothetical protein
MGWQPIETAPKDGTRILLGRFVKKCEHRRNFHVQVDYWNVPKRNGPRYTGWGRFNEHYWPPTHWMPLPDPPLPDQP